MIDESTNLSVDHNLVIYLRYVLGGEIHCRFLNLVELPGGTGSEIVDAVLNVLAMRNMLLNKLCGIATDGSSVIVGCRTGVTTQLKEKNLYLLSIHCIAHQLALASGQAADSVPYIKQLHINSIYKHFHCSTKNIHKLKEIQSVLQLVEWKFHQVFQQQFLP